MQSIFQEDSAPAEGTSRKTVARLVFGVLIVLSAAIGAATGVLFVNSTDLPQVGELEHYRPSSITQIYDDQKKVVG